MTAPVFLFPGQGSQEVGMAKAFYEQHAEARAVFEAAEEASGLEIKRLCFEGPEEELIETRNLQPAMTAAVLACFRVFQKTNDFTPSYYAGHSLGEYAALAAAGVITDGDCVKLTATRGRLMQEQAQANPGAMAAVMKADPHKVAEVVADLAKEHTICLANLNSPSQIVVSGTAEAIEALKVPIKAIRGRFRELKVSGAWHSTLMKAAEAPYNELVNGIRFADAAAPVLLNVTGSGESDGGVIKEQMKRQMCSGVRWYHGMLEAWEAGARTFIEFGPKPTLTKMLRTIVPDPSQQEIFLINDEEKLAAWQDRER